MKSSMLLISPPALLTRTELYFPTNFTILSAALKKAGFDAKILDLNILAALNENVFYDDPLSFCVRAIEETAAQADFFGMTTLCANYPLILQLAARLKQRFNKPVILGGAQASMTAQRTMELFPYIDFIVAYEGEITIVELLQSICGQTDPQDVKGIFYRRNGDVRATVPRPFIENLDDSPFPDFAALDVRAYQKIYPQVRIPVDVGRGCPFQCTFCSTSTMWKRMYRVKSPQRAVAEMDALHALFGVNHFYFTQDNLTTKKEYVYELCRALKDKHYAWDCYSRCDTLDDALLESMVAAGCRHVFFGIESGSERYQKIIKKNLRLADMEKAIDICLKHKVGLTTSYIIGFPEETREDISLTLKSCFRDVAHNAGQVKLNVLSPMPGTELAEKYSDRIAAPLAFQPDASRFILKKELAAEAKKMIAAYPDIFSSFYFIRPTHLDLDELFAIRQFYGLLVEEFPRTTYVLLQYSSMQCLALLDLYRKSGFPLDAEEAPTEIMARFFTAIIAQYAADLGRRTLLAKELLHYELAIYQLRRTPTPENLLESQSGAADLAPHDLRPERLSFTPAAVERSFAVDIYKILKALAVESRRYEVMDPPLEILFYEDALNGDIVQEIMDPPMKILLDHLRRGTLQDLKDRAMPLLELIKKGIVIYRAN